MVERSDRTGWSVDEQVIVVVVGPVDLWASRRLVQAPGDKRAGPGREVTACPQARQVHGPSPAHSPLLGADRVAGYAGYAGGGCGLPPRLRDWLRSPINVKSAGRTAPWRVGELVERRGMQPTPVEVLILVCFEVEEIQVRTDRDLLGTA